MLSAYTASKHGILGLTKNAAVEYANDGIRVNAVCPGAIMTPLMSAQPPERQQEILAPQALTRFGEPEEVAAAVGWLCSDQASFITGVALPVDAGIVNQTAPLGPFVRELLILSLVSLLFDFAGRQVLAASPLEVSGEQIGAERQQAGRWQPSGRRPGAAGQGVQQAGVSREAGRAASAGAGLGPSRT